MILQPEDTAPTQRACPVHGCRRVRELRGYRKGGTPVFRETCQAHRGTFIQADPPPPKPRTPWKPDPHADVVGLPPSAFTKPPVEKDRIRYRPKRAAPPDPHRLDVPALIAATITTANDGAWDITHQDLRLLADPRHTRLPAFEVSTLPGLSRPLPTSVVYRVWGMVERGELTPTEDA